MCPFIFIKVFKGALNFYLEDLFLSSYRRHQYCFMYRFFILVIFVLCKFLRHACKMHFCIVHDIIYDSAYTIDQVRHPVVRTVIASQH